MEAESNKTAKPDRSPDVVIKPGHACWWSEMVFMHVYGGVYKIKTDQENGSFYYSTDDGNGDERRYPLPKGAKLHYDQWWYEVFESKLLDVEESTTGE